MTCFTCSLVLISAAITVVLGSHPLLRQKRTLVWPQQAGVMQVIFGVGIPVDLEYETVIVGVNIRGVYGLIRNSTWYTSPNIIFARKKRAATSRWDIYKYLTGAIEHYGFSGKSCLLRTICEMAASPIETSTGLVDEMLHTLFTPSTTSEDITSYDDNEYHAAQQIGALDRTSCVKKFSDCSKSFLDMFTMFS